MVTSARSGDVSGFIAGIRNEARRADCWALVECMRSVTGDEPTLWGSSMVGFGTYHYRYASGREGDYFKVGFAPRKSDLVLYLMSGLVGYGDLLSTLGPHRAGKSAIYVKRLDDLERQVLANLIERSVAHIDQVEADTGAIPRMSEMPPYKP